tara:strand:+ start:291 stop:503 length:213 start_codon:yes stop_codon:yes gene_type:complete
MYYTVSDIGIEYETGEEIIGTVEAENETDAIIKALKNISPSMEVFITDAVNQSVDDFNKYILAAYKAKPN